MPERSVPGEGLTGHTFQTVSPVWRQIEKPSGTGRAGLDSQEASTGDPASWKGQDGPQNEHELQQERGAVSCFPAYRDKVGRVYPGQAVTLKVTGL